jgi:hypothetical protein
LELRLQESVGLQGLIEPLSIAAGAVGMVGHDPASERAAHLF